MSYERRSAISASIIADVTTANLPSKPSDSVQSGVFTRLILFTVENIADLRTRVTQELKGCSQHDSHAATPVVPDRVCFCPQDTNTALLVILLEDHFRPTFNGDHILFAKLQSHELYSGQFSK
jgi:hypothetical protein